MGIRSDVFLGFKTALWEALPEKHKDWLTREADKQDTTDEGKAFFFEEVKWYVGLDEDIDDLYKWLGEEEADDFIIVEACHDYPDSDDGDLGSWVENPWNAARHVSVEVYWEPSETSDT